MFCQPQRWWGFQCGGLGALQRCCGLQDADLGLPQRWWGVSVWWSGGATEVLWVGLGCCC